MKSAFLSVASVVFCALIFALALVWLGTSSSESATPKPEDLIPEIESDLPRKAADLEPVPEPPKREPIPPLDLDPVVEEPEDEKTTEEWFETYRNAKLRSLIGDRSVLHISELICHAQELEHDWTLKKRHARDDWERAMDLFRPGTQECKDADAHYLEVLKAAREDYGRALKDLVDRYAEDVP